LFSKKHQLFIDWRIGIVNVSSIWMKVITEGWSSGITRKSLTTLEKAFYQRLQTSGGKHHTDFVCCKGKER
jgi:hypothetical protein